MCDGVRARLREKRTCFKIMKHWQTKHILEPVLFFYEIPSHANLLEGPTPSRITGWLMARGHWSVLSGTKPLFFFVLHLVDSWCFLQRVSRLILVCRSYFSWNLMRWLLCPPFVSSYIWKPFFSSMSNSSSMINSKRTRPFLKPLSHIFRIKFHHLAKVY